MNKANATRLSRRKNVERNIYRNPKTGKLEVGFKDGAGVQRWRTVTGGITAARRLRDEVLAQRGRGERVVSNPRLRFGEAATRYLDDVVRDLRDTTRDAYTNSVEKHLLPRFATRRLDAIGPGDLAVLVREMRSEGLGESMISAALGVVGRIYTYAANRLGGPRDANPVSLMLPSERPKPSQGRRRVIFTGEQVEQTIAAAREPVRTALVVYALTGARESEVLGLTWADVRLDDLDDAELAFTFQVNRRGVRVPLKTDESARTVPIPRELALILAKHKLASGDVRPEAFVFATRTGRAISQRNLLRAFHAAQTRAVDAKGRPTFPLLHERDERGRRPERRGRVPNIHSFRHTNASRALLSGKSSDDVGFALGHRDGNVTRAVYIHEIQDARRRAAQRAWMTEQYGSALEAAAAVSVPADAGAGVGEVRELRGAS